MVASWGTVLSRSVGQFVHQSTNCSVRFGSIAASDDFRRQALKHAALPQPVAVFSWFRLGAAANPARASNPAV